MYPTFGIWFILYVHYTQREKQWIWCQVCFSSNDLKNCNNLYITALDGISNDAQISWNLMYNRSLKKPTCWQIFFFLKAFGLIWKLSLRLWSLVHCLCIPIPNSRTLYRKTLKGVAREHRISSFWNFRNTSIESIWPIPMCLMSYNDDVDFNYACMWSIICILFWMFDVFCLVQI